MSFQERMDACMAAWLTSDAAGELEKAIASANIAPHVAEWMRALGVMCYAQGAHDACADVRAQLMDFSLGD